MKRVINLYKPPGATPLELINAFKKQFPEYKDTKLGYAGRLDPMAEGVLLVLAGEVNKKRKEYESLRKSYTFDLLFGVVTDTYDALGMITDTSPDVLRLTSSNLRDVIADTKKVSEQKYPPFSSRTVNGKPLYYWAREDKLDEITIPHHPITIYDFRLVTMQSISSKELLGYISQTVGKTTGDFRQKKILAQWEKYLRKNRNHTTASCAITCSSGTYVRSLCHEIGQRVSTGGIALRIRRERIGAYTLEESLKLTS